MSVALAEPPPQTADTNGVHAEDDPPLEVVPPQSALAIRPLTIAEFEAMFDHGILSEDEPVELLRGQVVYRFVEAPLAEDESVNPKPKHVLVNKLTYDLFSQAVVGFDACVYNQSPTRLKEGRLPLPDVFIARGNARDYAERHPEPADTLFCLEVSDTTLKKDTGEKRREYAAAGVSHYAVIDLVHERVEVWTDPREDGSYRTHYTFGRGDDVELRLDVVGDVVVAVDDLLPF